MELFSLTKTTRIEHRSDSVDNCFGCPQLLLGAHGVFGVGRV
jgi:hypothetical protein